MFTKLQLRRRWRVLAAIASAATVGLMAAAPAAADGPLPVDPGDASLTIVKLTTPVSSTPANGLPQSLTGSAVSDVTFKVYPVVTTSGGVTIGNLTTADSWAAANKVALDPNSITNAKAAAANISVSGMTLGTAKSATTGSDGTVTFSNLPLGLYFVQETRESTAGTFPLTDAFFVTVPMTDPTSTDSAWNYHVYVYPKDAYVTVDKTKDMGTSVTPSQSVNYTIMATIPNESTISAYRIVDRHGQGQGTLSINADANGLASAATDTPIAVSIISADGLTTTPLVNCASADADAATCEYTVENVYSTTGWDGTIGVASDQTYFQIDFTNPAGLAALATANATPGAKVQVTYAATIQSSDNQTLGGTADTYRNDVLVYAASDEEADPTDFPPATDYESFTTGQFLIYKKAANTGTGLQGAEFQIYRNPDPQTTTCDQAVQDDANLVSMYFTLADGSVGPYNAPPTTLQPYTEDQALDNGKNGYGNGYYMTGELVLGADYCAVESVAPEGYFIGQGAFAFTASLDKSMGPWNATCMETNSAWTVQGCMADATMQVENPLPILWTVTNDPINAGFTLPLTGWNGTQTTLAAVGLVFVGLATAYAVKARRSSVATAA